ncbi:tripartite tricarboxylate transporter substrate binding protein [Bacillus fonticola]|uniref:tripartite tricarboxylate transporter substrate binding protein n=1 Tax=Bacillus fonticola TaxID=2728853 RepID=UPI001474E884|nr:tripartite tricarboxylate transporter substrate-binding protein [Bacillus fonticola]
MKKWLVLFLLLVLTLAGCSSTNSSTSTGEDGEWAPPKQVEIVAPAGAGGGWDTTARMVAKVLDEEEILEQNVGVINKPGGGGAVGWAYVQSVNNPSNIFVSSPPLIFVPLSGQSEYETEDFTPLANLIADYAAFAVREDAPWDNLNELFDAMKEDPSSVTVVGTSSPGSMDHVQFIQIAKAAGVDIKNIKYVSAPDGGGLTQLLNGSVQVYSTGVAETVEQVKAGKIKVLGITAPERLEGEVLSEFPTAIEQGIDATFVNWRGFFGPKEMTEDQIKFYEEKLKEVSESEAFANIRAQYGWDEMYMGSEDYKAFIEEQKGDISSILDELGLLQN